MTRVSDSPIFQGLVVSEKSQKRVSDEKKVLKDSVFYVSAAWVVKTSRLDARHLLFERGALNFVRNIEEFEQD